MDDWRLADWEHPTYGNRFMVWEKQDPTNKVEVFAWNRKNARNSGARLLKINPARVAVSDKPLHLTESPVHA